MPNKLRDGAVSKSVEPDQAITEDRPAKTSLRLEWIDADSLAENPANWRRHPPEQLAALQDVLAEVGWAGACLYNERTKRLIDGHLRKKVSRGKGKVPVLVGSWSEEQEKKILATLDPIAALAEADKVALDALLRELETDSPAIKKMLAELAAGDLTPLFDPGVTPGLVDPDDIPAPPDKAVTQPGDLWLLGENKLLCGNAGKTEDVDRLLDGAAVHLVNTDPPYNVKLEPRSNNAIAAGLSSFPPGDRTAVEACDARGMHHSGLDVARHPAKARPTTKKLRAKDRPLANDFVSDKTFDEFLAAWFGNMARVLLAGRAFYIWGGYSNIGNYPAALKTAGLYFSQTIIWVKEHPVLTRKDFMGNHEWAFYG